MSDSNESTLSSEKALELARAAFKGSTDYFDTNIRKRIDDDIRRFNSKFPSGSKYHSDGYRTRSRIFRPKTRATIRKNEAVAAEGLFSTLDLTNITPGDETNPLQVASADVMAALLQYRLTKSIPWFLLCMGGYQDAQTVGVVVSHQFWEYNPKKKKDQPQVDIVPLENFRFDPGSKWYDPVGSSPYLIHMIPMWVKDIKARMKSGRWKSMTDAEILSAVTQYDSTRGERENNRTDSTQQITSITDYTIVWVHRNVIEWEEQDYIYYTLGDQVLLSEPDIIETEYAHGKRPFTVGCCVIETHKVYPAGPNHLGANIQEEINEVTNQRLDNVKFVLNKRYFVKRNKQVDLRSLTRNVPSSVTLLTDPDQDVKIVETNDVTSSSYNEQDRLNLDYDDIAGSFSGSSVASNRKLNETVGGMNILTGNANQVQAYQLKVFVETWVEPVLRQLMLLEQHYETDDKIIALCSKKAQLFQKFGIDSATDELLAQELTLNVNVGMGAINPSDKVNTLALGMGTIRTVLADGLLEKYGLKPQELIKEVLGALGHKDGGRFFEFEESEDPRIQEMLSQIDQLQQALDAKHPPELIAAQVSKLNEEAKKINADRVKSGIEGSYSAVQTAQTVAMNPTLTPVADQIMQMNGYTLPNPVGVDPNIQAPAMANPMAMDIRRNTHPMLPANPPDPQSPFVGAERGIETQAADGSIPQ